MVDNSPRRQRHVGTFRPSRAQTLHNGRTLTTHPPRPPARALYGTQRQRLCRLPGWVLSWAFRFRFLT